jgi:hypothetical protein
LRNGTQGGVPCNVSGQCWDEMASCSMADSLAHTSGSELLTAPVEIRTFVTFAWYNPSRVVMERRDHVE